MEQLQLTVWCPHMNSQMEKLTNRVLLAHIDALFAQLNAYTPSHDEMPLWLTLNMLPGNVMYRLRKLVNCGYCTYGE